MHLSRQYAGQRMGSNVVALKVDKEAVGAVRLEDKDIMAVLVGATNRKLPIAPGQLSEREA